MTSYIDPGERLSADDMATRTEAMFLEGALRRQQLQAAASTMAPGRCANCNETCLPLAVYCDAGCRADHERQVKARSRNGLQAR